MLEDDIEDIVNVGWALERYVKFMNRRDGCVEELKRWSKQNCKKSKQETVQSLKEMERYHNFLELESVVRFFMEKRWHQKVISQEEAFWKQHAKMHQLKDGNLNTKFFHMSIMVWIQFKKIIGLVNEGQVEVRDQIGLCEVAKEYFSKLFSLKEGNCEPVLSLIHQRISRADNEKLMALIKKEELYEALIQMHSNKSQGLVDLVLLFINDFGVCMVMTPIVLFPTGWREFFFPSTLNDTNIFLILKCENPCSMKDMHPISLCNVVYKMVPKLLGNRLKGVIPQFSP